MSHRNFAFWFCTLLSGVVIGIASQRIPERSTNNEAFKPLSYASYCTDLSPLQIHRSGYSLAYDVHYHNKKESIP